MAEDTDDKAPPGTAKDEYVEVKILISKKVYERARAIVAEKDPAKSGLGEWAGYMDVPEYLGQILEIHFED